MGTSTTGAAALQTVVTERIADVTLRLFVEGGQLLIGPNDVVLELSRSPGRPDLSGVTLFANQTEAGGRPVEVSLSLDRPGRFHGTMILSSTGNCRLELAWQDERGPQSHTFTVPVVVGHH